MKRSYQSERREQQAKITSDTILMSAKSLFQKNGFQKVTIDMLAEASNVSTATIYAVFKSKIGVLRALLDQTVPVDLKEQHQHAKSARERLHITAKYARHLYSAERQQIEIMQGASILSPELKELKKEYEQRRYEKLKDSIKQIVAENNLHPAMNSSLARDTLWALTSRDMFYMLVIERGWSENKYQKWLENILVTTLLNSEK